MFRANNFEKLLDKATSNLRLEPDWPTILQICDLIRQNDCSPKAAVAGVKKKLESQNPHQAMFALLTLESIVKNCGSGVHDEVASKAFCEQLRDLVKNTQHENVRTKILELIQAWAFAFRNSPKYRCVQDTVNILKTEGFKFPPLKESDAMFSADTAPEWADGEVCHRCRVAFSMIVRRHHCRACGQVFCQQCSAKTSTLPKFGIEKEVRVCDACFDKVSRPPSSTAKIDIVDTSNDYGPTPAPAKKAGKTAEELQEEEELQLALALSQSEAEQKEKERRSKTYIAPTQSLHPTISPSPSSVSASPEHTNSNTTNPELSRYLDRNYWEQRRDNTTAPTAPSSQAPTSPSEEFAKASSTNTKAPDDDAEYKEIDDFVAQLKSQIEIFVNRMKSNSSRGRSIANDTSVQTLFMNITAMHSRLLKYIQQQDDKRVYLESLQDKISQIRDSRAALDTLRAEHAARVAAAAEAAERRRQMQMAAKLEAMRKKKHEYLQYQRQLALQRVQEQERELQLRQEQQKHQYMMSSNSGYYNMPGVTGMHQFQQPYPNQPMYAGQQFPPHMMGTSEQPMSGQPQVTQAGLSHGGNIHSTIAQSMPQLPQTYATTGPMQMSQAQINTQASMQQPNMRQPLQQQLPLQTQMMIQQMHQMRMAGPVQTGQQMPQNIVPQNIVNGQNVSQHNGQAKQHPAQIPHSMMPHMSLGQTNLAQQQASTTNPMMGMPMQNMRLPGAPAGHQLPQQMPASAYQMNMQNNPQHQMPNMQQPNMPTQMHQQGQPHMGGPQQQMMQGQMGNQAMAMQGGQMPQQGGQMSQQGVQMPQQVGQMPQQSGQMPQQGGQMPQQGGQMSQQSGQMQLNQGQVPQSQNPQQINHNQIYQSHPMQGAPQSMPNQQQIPNQGQNMPPNQMAQGHNIPPHQMGNPGQMSQQMPSQMQGPAQMPPGQQYPQQMQIPQAQGIPNQSIPQQQQSLGQLPPGQQQPMKMPPQNFAPPPGPSQQIPPQQVKSEHNNNTAELISFD